jgi:aminoglycoside/choline kinase family phosphotransferase
MNLSEAINIFVDRDRTIASINLTGILDALTQNRFNGKIISPLRYLAPIGSAEQIKMLDQTNSIQIIAQTISRRLGLPSHQIGVERLCGDASNRTYYRVRLLQEKDRTSYVVMKLAEPEAFKASEEKITTNTIATQELPYLNIQKHLDRCGVAVPKIYFYDAEYGILLLQDLGDVQFHDAVSGSDRATQQRKYQMAIDEQLKIQIRGSRLADGASIAFGRAFDLPLLMWEFDHFLEYGIEQANGQPMAKQDRDEIRSLFLPIAETLAKEPRCLTHRDYHSRNLMIHQDRVWVLDFQDALMGPSVYDLASLLKDSYVKLEEDLIDEMIEYYVQKKESMDRVRPDRPAFRRLFDIMSIQRNLKAAGRFVYIDVVKKNDRFLKYVPQTLGYVKRNLEKYPELGRLKLLLARYCRDFA